MPKLIALIVLAVGVGGYIIFEVFTQVMPPAPTQAAASPAPSATPGAAQVASAAGGGAPLPGAANTVPAAATSLYPSELDPSKFTPQTNGRDPFAQTLSTAVNPMPVHTVPPPAMSTAFAQSHMVNRIAPTLPVAPNPTPAAKPTPPPPPPPVPPYTVVGVVLADRNATGQKSGTDVAILRSGSDRRFVAVGDPVANGYTVAAIHSSGVDVRIGDHIATLPLAGGPTSPSGAASSGKP